MLSFNGNVHMRDREMHAGRNRNEDRVRVSQREREGTEFASLHLLLAFEHNTLIEMQKLQLFG